MQISAVRSGTLISHYRVLSAVGSGGMGEVYLAQDERLGRKVALKILPSEFVTDRLRLERFEREARATSALNHPNILTIYDLGEENGRYFIASEFIEGETLRRRLSRAPKLREVVEISIQVAGALAAAHAEGVVHRDLKPENIMIRRDGYVKVLDFGLAKLQEKPSVGEQSEAATVRRATDPGVVMGTVQYMSPEQAQGLAVDGRSDIFSFGVVMYEMITGHLPFEGATKSHIIVSILEKQPAPLHRHVSDVPAELQRIVSKCLSKEADDRYQVAKDLLIDLKSLRHELEVSTEIETRSDEQVIETGVARTTSSAEYLIGEIKRHRKGALITSAIVAVIAIVVLILPTLTREAESGQRMPIAVADFANQTGQPELDGLSGMLITSLEQSRRLAVMTRSRMFDTLKRLGKDQVERVDENLGREICRAENVKALVTASISKFGDLYILDLKVLDPEKNEYLFTAKEQGRGAERIPDLIDRLAEKTRLGLKEKSDEVRSSSEKIANVTTTNLDAYQHYFRGQQLIAQLQFEKAEEEFGKATELDPTFALAHHGRAYALNWLGSRRASEHILLAMQYIDKAPEKERSLIRAEKAAMVDRDWDQKIAILNQLIDRYPNEKQAVFEVADLAFHRRDYVTAENYLRRVLEMDSNFEPALQHLVWTYRDSGRFEEMLQQAHRYMQTVPSEEAYANLTSAYAFSGDLDNALEVSRRAVERFGATPASVSQLVHTYAHRGEYDAATAEARKLLGRERSAADRQEGYRLLAFVHGYRGEYRAAFSRFEQALALTADANDPEKATTVALEARAMAWSRLDDRKASRLASQSLELKESLTLNAYFPLFDAYTVLRQFEPARQIATEHFWGAKSWVYLLEGLDKLNKGDATFAIPDLEMLVSSESALFSGRYYLAQAQLEAGHYDQAIDSARRAQEVYFWFWPHEHVYPRTYYLLGKIHERKGDRKAARENYRKFLDLWKTADNDLPELIDAKNRLAQLEDDRSFRTTSTNRTTSSSVPTVTRFQPPSKRP